MADANKVQEALDRQAERCQAMEDLPVAPVIAEVLFEALGEINERLLRTTERVRGKSDLPHRGCAR